MSYSFSIRAKNKAAAKTAFAVEFDKIISQQPVHAKDQSAACATVNAYIDLLPDDSSKDVHISGSGSVSGAWEQSTLVLLNSASINISAALVNPLPA